MPAVKRASHKDYSGTPLPGKLGIRPGSRLLLVGEPEGFSLGVMPPDVEVVTRVRPPLDVVVFFVTRGTELRRRLPGLVPALDPAGRLWVAWPKKAAATDTDLTFAIVQAAGLSAGLVDNKSASIDEVFQGLQFVYRLADRARAAKR